MQTSRSFRGISRRLAVKYLENLGGERTGGESSAKDQMSDQPRDQWDVEGDGWRARLSDRQVAIGPTLTLTEVTVDFEGDEATLDDLIPKFAQKAMRAGG